MKHRMCSSRMCPCVWLCVGGRMTCGNTNAQLLCQKQIRVSGSSLILICLWSSHVCLSNILLRSKIVLFLSSSLSSGISIIDRSQIIIKKRKQNYLFEPVLLLVVFVDIRYSLSSAGGILVSFSCSRHCVFFLLSIRPFMRITLLLVQFPNKKSLKS